MQEAQETKVNPAEDPFALFKGQQEQQVADTPEPQAQEEVPTQEEEQPQEELTFDDAPEQGSQEASTDETQPEAASQEEDDFAWLGSEEESSQEGEEPLETATDTNAIFEELGKAIGSDVFDDQNAIIEKAKSIAKENAELKEQLNNGDSPFANELFERANEIAKQGGDYLQYLGIASIDYDQFSDEVLLDEFVAKAYIPGDTQEAVEKRQEYLDDMTESQKSVEANKVRAQLKAEQEAQMKEAGELSQRQQAEQQKIVEEVNKSLQEAYKKADKLFGMKLETADKKRHYKALTDGSLNQTMYHNEKGEFDPQRAIENAWLLERDSKGELVNVKNLVKTYISRSKNEGKAEMLKEASNVDIKRNPKKAEVSTGEVSPMANFVNMIKEGKA